MKSNLMVVKLRRNRNILELRVRQYDKTFPQNNNLLLKILLVPGRSPECSDSLFSLYSNNNLNKSNVKKIDFVKNYPPHAI